MRRRTVLLTVAVMGILWSALAGADEPAGKEPATQPAEKLAEFIVAVREAKTARLAITAYARGCAVDRGQPELHDAYMRRMLKFGLPKIAYYPARVLVTLQPENGKAWGVLGYMDGQRGELDRALADTIRAAELDRDDPSILNNAGQLAAWYDMTTDTPKVSDAAKRALARIREDLARREAFAKAYRGVEEAYKQQVEVSRELDGKVAAAEAAVLALEQLILDVDRRIRDLEAEIAQRQEAIDRLRRDLRYTRWSYYTDPSGRVIYLPRSDSGYDRETRLRIRQEEQVIDDLELKIRALRREGQALLAERKVKRAELEQLQAQKKQAAERIERKFRWDPPAVDGVVTDEREYVPLEAEPAEPAERAPEAPQGEAARRLDLAKLFLNHDLNERGVQILREVIAEFGSTPAAEEARRLLRDSTAAPPSR